MITDTTLKIKDLYFPGPIVSTEEQANSILFKCENQVHLKVEMMEDGLIRFRYTTQGVFEPDFSYAIDKHFKPQLSEMSFSDSSEYYFIKTNLLTCRVAKKDARVTLFDFNNKIILEDELGFHWEEPYESGGNLIKMTKHATEGESFFGLGDKASHLNMKGKKFENWATDQYSYKKDQDPLYKVIPFYIGLHSKIAYGIFFDNTFRSSFDFCGSKKNITHFEAEGGEMNYYFIYGPLMQDVVVKYTHLTGKPELPPLWALGYHQCKWSYYPEKKVREIAQTFRELQIPCDAIYLDIDYMDGFRCFTWNKEYFPDPKQMVSDLAADGFKTIAIIDPGIKIDPNYSVYQEGLTNDYFCHRADGPYMKGKVWPGFCHFPDFTNPEVRHWWMGLFQELISDIGIRGVWNDMNEPAVMEVPDKTFPLDVRHHYEGNPCSHRKAHNIYGMQMARATYHGVKRFAYPQRPFIITRSAYAGTQRYSSTWTGDNIASWEHLWIANVQMQRMSLSGMGFVGSDIGGFTEQPTPELYARWMQLGVFHPFCRTHSSGDHGEQEPWSFGEEVVDVVRKFVELRYRLLPYLYTMFWKYVNEGIPLLKPLVYFDQEDPHTYYRTDEFIFGEQILVCPILEPNVLGRRVYVPKGSWYNMWNSEKIEGGKEHWIATGFEEIPVLIKAGAVIPKYPVQQYVGQLAIDELTLDIYYKLGDEQTQVYEDAQDGYDYSKGHFSLLTFQVTGTEQKLQVELQNEGDFESPYNQFKINVIGLPFQATRVRIDEEEMFLESLQEPGSNALMVSKYFRILELY
jgi:alpha-glucosidase